MSKTLTKLATQPHFYAMGDSKSSLSSEEHITELIHELNCMRGFDSKMYIGISLRS